MPLVTVGDHGTFSGGLSFDEALVVQARVKKCFQICAEAGIRTNVDWSVDSFFKSSEPRLAIARVVSARSCLPYPSAQVSSFNM